MNYLSSFLSLWIANFGVLPWFSFAFFLSLPAFLSLNALLDLVFIVLEPITVSLNYIIKIYKKNSSIYLTVILLFVKVNLGHIGLLYAAQKILPQDIFLSKGEQIELNLSDMNRFSIGNQEVIKHIYRPKKKKILIKGKSIGFSDLIIWKKNGTKKVYRLYIISKKEQLSKIQMAQTLKSIGLTVTIQGPVIVGTGTIETLQNYLIIKSIVDKKAKHIVLNIQLGKSLKNTIIKKVYTSVFQSKAKNIICKSFDLEIRCEVTGMTIKSPILKMLKDKYMIQFYRSNGSIKDINYLASFKIIQIENSSQQNIAFGLSKITSSIGQVLNNSNASLINGERLEFSELGISAKLLAEPQTTLTLENTAKIQLGGEIPFKTTSRDGSSNTNWKFYGLKISTKMKAKLNNLFVHYSTELTSPNQQSVNGSKSSSSVYVPQGRFIKLFEVGYKVDQKSIQSMPWLGKIPILKYLFSANQDSNIYKQIICFVKITEVNNE